MPPGLARSVHDDDPQPKESREKHEKTNHRHGVAGLRADRSSMARAFALREVIDQVRQALRQTEPTVQLAPEDLRSLGSANKTLPKVNRLEGTALQAEAVRPKIQQWLGQEPRVLLEGQASEAMLKSVKNPRVLVLATHGYFLPTQEVESKDRVGLDLGEGNRTAALIDKQGQPIENPLLRCGLLLAGCNKRAEAKPGEDDGAAHPFFWSAFALTSRGSD
jgi:CHAT domain-containing protein